MRNRRNIGIVFLMIATFLNPLGYAELHAWVDSFIGDYWTTTYIFYVFAALLFLASFFLLKINPLTRIVDRIRRLKRKPDDEVLDDLIE